MFSKIFSLATLVAAASAYTVLTPTLNSTVAKGKSTSVTWSSVDTDASQFSIYLVNFKDWPPTVISLAQNVPQSDNSVDVTIPCDVKSDYGWQLNFINGTNTYVIYAQSNAFSLTGSCVDPTTSSSVSSHGLVRSTYLYRVLPSGTGSGPKSTTTGTTPVFTGAATSVQAGSMLALIAGAAVALL
ncbi:hypothetical protein QC760_000966 [Botrytis cinerea]